MIAAICSALSQLPIAVTLVDCGRSLLTFNKGILPLVISLNAPNIWDGALAYGITHSCITRFIRTCVYTVALWGRGMEASFIAYFATFQTSSSKEILLIATLARIRKAVVPPMGIRSFRTLPNCSKDARYRLYIRVLTSNKFIFIL